MANVCTNHFLGASQMRTHKKHPNDCCCDVPVVDLAEGLDPMEEVEATISGDEFPLATLNNHTPSIVQAPGGDGEDQWRGYGAQCKSQAGEVVVAKKLTWAGRHVTTSPRPPTHTAAAWSHAPLWKQVQVQGGKHARSSQRNDAARATCNPD